MNGRRDIKLCTVLLAVALIPYLLMAPPLFMAVILLVPFLAALLAPGLALGLLLGLAPVIDGVGRWWLAGTPPPPFLLEPMVMAAGAGLLMRLHRKPGPAVAAVPGLTLFTGSVACSLALSLLRLLPAWQDQWPSFLTMAWMSLPQPSPLAVEHSLRAGLLILAGAGWFSLLRRALPAGEGLRLPALGWLLGAAVAAAYGTWGWAAGHSTQWPYAVSTLEDRNSYGSYLVLTFFLAWAWISPTSSLPRRIAGLASMAMAAWMLLLSGSKSALAAALAGCLLIAVKEMSLMKRRSVVRLLAAAGLVLAVGVVAVRMNSHSRLALTVERMVTPNYLITYLAENRLPVWTAAMQAATTYPVLGMGPGMLYRHLGHYYPAPQTDGWQPVHENAHNGFLQFAAETGLASMLAFMWLMLLLLRQAMQKPLWWRGPPGLLATGLAACLATMLTGHPLLLSRQTFLFWSALGLLAVLLMETGDGAAAKPAMPGTTAFRFMPKWPAAILLLIPLALVIQPFDTGCAATNRPSAGPVWDYAAGFHAQESDDREQWRWMKSAGELRLCPADNGAPIEGVELTLSSFARPRAVTAGGMVQPPVLLPLATDTERVMLPVATGASGGSIIFTTSPGARHVHHERAGSDGRRLALRLSGSPQTVPSQPAATD